MDPLRRAAMAAMEANDLPEMIGLGDELLAREPGDHLGLAAVASAMLKSEKFGIAGMLLGALTKMRPDDAEAWNNLACALQEYHPKDALACLKRARELAPDLEAPLQNMVGVLSTLGQFREAAEIGRDYLARHDAHDPDVNHNLALAELQLGDWAQAWPRWQHSHKRKEREYAYRGTYSDGVGRWNGRATVESDLTAAEHRHQACVVIYGEQGLGDEILAASWIGHAVGSGAQIIVECEPRLEGLFQRSFPRANVYGTLLEQSPDWVTHERPTHKIESMGLGQLYAPKPFREGAYLIPDPDYRRMFRGLLDSLGEGMKVGIAWTGGVKPWDRAQRCIQPDVLRPILASPGCQFVSLEYQFDGPPPEGVHEFPWATAKGVDYDLTAALIAELDLVISVPQTCVDAAGAIGTTCWVLTPPVPQWRFSHAAGDEAWVYNGIHLIRHEGPFWQGAVAKAAKRLRAVAAAHAAQPANRRTA